MFSLLAKFAMTRLVLWKVTSESAAQVLTHFMPLGSFDSPWKHQETKDFLMSSGGIERDQWHEMGYAPVEV